jgi:hypothetical protein
MEHTDSVKRPCDDCADDAPARGKLNRVVDQETKAGTHRKYECKICGSQWIESIGPQSKAATSLP